VQQAFTVGPGAPTLSPQTISFTSSPPGGAVAGGPAYTVAATASSGLAVVFTIASASAGVCAVSGATVSLVGVGTCTINANQAGNASYEAALQVQQSFTVATPPPASQTISFTSSAPGAAVYGGSSYLVSATATSGVAVSFTAALSSAGVCTVSGSTVTIVGAGTCTINANQAGNASYEPALQVQQSFTVATPPPASQTISFTSSAPGAAVYGGPSYSVSAVATSGLAVGFAAAPSSAGVCTVSGTTVAIVGAGTCTVNANQSGNSSYLAAPQVQQSFTVARASQTITITSTPPPVDKHSPPYTITATATSGLAVTFSIAPSSSAVCSISGSSVSFKKHGDCIVRANQAGNANYLPAPQVQQVITVLPHV
jgi:large repetitive protein